MQHVRTQSEERRLELLQSHVVHCDWSGRFGLYRVTFLQQHGHTLAVLFQGRVARMKKRSLLILTALFNVMETAPQIELLTHSGGTCMISPTKLLSFSSTSNRVMCSEDWKPDHQLNVELKQTGVYELITWGDDLYFLPKSFSPTTLPVASRVSVAFPSSPTAMYFWRKQCIIYTQKCKYFWFGHTFCTQRGNKISLWSDSLTFAVYNLSIHRSWQYLNP